MQDIVAPACEDGVSAHTLPAKWHSAKRERGKLFG